MKIFRDPIHNVIDLDTGDKNVNDLLINLVDSKEFQRLHYIKQLGFAYCAYPSAVHTRFEHSLGVAFLAKRFLNKIVSIEDTTLRRYENTNNRAVLIDFFERIKQYAPLTITAALLHDIGHGPLSHVIEGFTQIKHEEWVTEIIMGDTDIHKCLMEYNQAWPQAICDILNGNSDTYYPAKILSGHIDIDKMDYLLRDSHMTGSGYGKFDIEWLINVVTIGIKDGCVEIGLDLGKGLSVAEDLVMARIYMYKNVYLHKVTLVAQHMLKKLLERLKMSEASVQEVSFPNKSLQKIFISTDLSAKALLTHYLSISDIDFIYFIKSLQESSDGVLRDLSYGLFNRRLFKELDQNSWNNLRNSIEEKSGKGMADYYTQFVQIDSKDERLVYNTGEDEMIFFDKDGSGFLLSEKSSVVKAYMHTESIPLGYYAACQIYNGDALHY
jgi:HD superfamily phosphohydrolase